MSEQPEVVQLDLNSDSAFANLVDALAPGADGEADPPSGETPPPAGGVAPDAGGVPPAAPATPGTEAAPAAGGVSTEGSVPGGETTPTSDLGTADPEPPTVAGGEPGADATTGAGDRPAAWTASASELIPKINELASSFEERTRQSYQTAALEEVKTEHAKYFDVLNKHPRLLVGVEVPAIGKEGNETLRDANDAAQWQEAVKSVLVEEINDRAQRAIEENTDFINVVHQSIQLFQENTDLIPGTVEFDVDLANRFTALAEPYELRVDGKLQGYSIPVQPIINQIRAQLVAERSKSAEQPSAAATAPTPAAAPAAPPPQAGIQSKAGNSSEGEEDFSTLFGTIGLPNLRI